MKTLSVIVPVYRVEEYLEECVRSILTQDFRDYELILVDDGSPDGCPAMCDRFAEEDARIRVIHKPNGGVASALNAGIGIAKGRYIQFLDSDDLLSPGTLGPNVAALDAHPEADFVQYPILERYGSDDPFERRASAPVLVEDGKEIFRSWQRMGVITGYVHNKIFRRELFRELRFPEGMIFEDRYLETDLFPRCKAVWVSVDGEYLYRERPGSLVKSKRSKYYWRSLITADVHLLKEMKRIGGLPKQVIIKSLKLLSYHIRELFA